MHSTDREAFEAKLGILFAGFPALLTPPRVEAFWIGLQGMPLSMFDRCVDRILGPDGEERLPTPNRVWKISKQLRAAAPPKLEQPQPAPKADEFTVSGNFTLFAYLCRHPASDERVLQALVQAKNHWCNAYRDISADEPGAANELRPKLIAAFNQVTGLDVQPEHLLSQIHAAERAARHDESRPSRARLPEAKGSEA